MVVEPGALQVAIVHAKAERLDKMEIGRGVGGEPDHVARIAGNLRMDEDHRETRSRSGIDAPAARHYATAGGNVRATTHAFDAHRARAPQRRCRLGQRRAGGHDVVDECDGETADVAPAGEGAANVLRALRPAQRSLRRAARRAFEDVHHRQPEEVRHTHADLAGLVESALALARGSERYGGDDRGPGVVVASRDGLRSRSGERRRGPFGEREARRVFELLQQTVHRKGVDERGDGRRKRRRMREACATDRRRRDGQRADGARGRQPRQGRGARRAHQRVAGAPRAQRAGLRQREPRKRGRASDQRVPPLRGPGRAPAQPALSNDRAARFDNDLTSLDTRTGL